MFCNTCVNCALFLFHIYVNNVDKASYPKKDVTEVLTLQFLDSFTNIHSSHPSNFRAWLLYSNIIGSASDRIHQVHMITERQCNQSTSKYIIKERGQKSSPLSEANQMNDSKSHRWLRENGCCWTLSMSKRQGSPCC